MDLVIVIAAMVLNPIARRRRAALDTEAQGTGASSVSSHTEAASVEPTNADTRTQSAVLAEPKDDELRPANTIAESSGAVGEQEKSAERE